MNFKKRHTLSLCMIAKNEEANLPTLWQSVKGIIDEWIVVDTGSTDKTVEIATKLGARVITVGDQFTTVLTQDHKDFFKAYGIEIEIGNKIFEFGKARSFSFEQATQDYILWLDGDDILIGREKLVEIMNHNLDSHKQVGIHLLYKYDFDQYRNCILEHYRERIVPNNKTCKWQGRIHEIIVPTIETEYIRVLPKDCHVVHNAINKTDSSNNRNLKALLLDLYNQRENPDPRTLFFLAEAFALKGDIDRATKLYEHYLLLSGWDEERCLAAVRLSKLNIAKKDYQRALDYAYRAVKERPDYPIGYSALCQVYYCLEDWGAVEKFGRLAIDTDQPETVAFVDPKYNQFIPLFILANTYMQNGRYKEAALLAQQALNYEPLNEELQKIEYTSKRILAQDNLIIGVKSLIDYCQDEGEILLSKKILHSLPNSLSNDPRIDCLKEDVKTEIVKRSQNWIDLPVRCIDSNNIPVQYLLLHNDLKKFRCESILLVSNDKILAGWLEHQKIKVHRVTDLNNETCSVDAVFFDYQLHMFDDEARKQFIRLGTKQATKYVGFCVPSSDSNALTKCSTELVESWLTNRMWNLMGLANGVIYASSIISYTRDTKITFFCGGQSTETWGPLSHVQGGCGGSEEATIYLTRELAIQGFDIEVINNYPYYCYVDGVRWRNVSLIKEKEEFDTVILWRLPHFIEDYNLKAKQFFLWLHDVPETYWFTPERLEKIKKIICLSKYHRTLLPDISDDKIIISQNGVDCYQFMVEVKRNQNKVIYTSSYDRGLEHLLSVWPEIKEQCPKAELHIFYGWGTYDKLRTDPKQREWKSKMIELMKLPGVVEHGRIGQKDLAKEFVSSSIFAYPCTFEEISCISAMKAQVAGCIPLTTDYAALAETNQTDYKIKGNPKMNNEILSQFKDKLIQCLKNPIFDSERIEIAKKAVAQFQWSRVAKDWTKFITGEANV